MEKEQESGPVEVKGPDGKKVRMFLTHHAPQAAKKWWQPAVMALLAGATTWLTVRVQPPEPGRDARDKDVIALQGALQTLWRAHSALRDADASMRERVGYLEGCLHVRNQIWTPDVPVIAAPDQAKVDQSALNAYQEARK